MHLTRPSLKPGDGVGARSGIWNAGFYGNGTVQQPGNYLSINFTGLHGDGVVDNFTFYPAVYSGPNQIPCSYFMCRGNVAAPIDAVDSQRGNVRVRMAPLPLPLRLNSRSSRAA